MTESTRSQCPTCGVASRGAATCPSCGTPRSGDAPATKPGDVGASAAHRSVRRPPRPAASATADRSIYQKRVHHGRSMTDIKLGSRNGRIVDGLLLLLAMHAMQLLWLLVKPGMLWFIWATQFTYVLPASAFMVAMRRWRTLAGLWIGALITLGIGLLVAQWAGAGGG